MNTKRPLLYRRTLSTVLLALNSVGLILLCWYCRVYRQEAIRCNHKASCADTPTEVLLPAAYYALLLGLVPLVWLIALKFGQQLSPTLTVLLTCMALVLGSGSDITSNFAVWGFSPVWVGAMVDINVLWMSVAAGVAVSIRQVRRD